MPEGSYTTYLFREGIDKIGKKIGEEAAEVIIAAKNGDPGPLAQEASDLIYHLLVMLEAAEVPVEDVWAVLSARRGSKDAAGSSGRQG
ncbi:MAG: phosphoribosyl-ATP diphosphatase [Thermomicrobiales bacterium]